MDVQELARRLYERYATTIDFGSAAVVIKDPRGVTVARSSLEQSWEGLSAAERERWHEEARRLAAGKPSDVAATTVTLVGGAFSQVGDARRVGVSFGPDGVTTILGEAL